MALLYANENFPLQVVEALRQLGHDVLTVREAGLDNQRVSNADVLAYATANTRPAHYQSPRLHSPASSAVGAS